MNFVLVNENVVAKHEANLTDFMWDKPILMRQNMWFGFGGIPFFDENIAAITTQLESLGAALPPLFSNKRELYRLSKRILNKNKFYRSGYLCYHFFVASKQVNFMCTSHAFSTFNFPFEEEGLLANISSVKKNSMNKLSALRCHSQMLWDAAKAELQTSDLANSILLNEKDNICEGIGSNLFFVKDKVLITPSLSTGCHKNVLRDFILDTAKKLKIRVIEVPEIQKEHLLEMDEVFLASEEFGIQWLLGIDNKRFVHELSENIYWELNKIIERKVEKGKS